MPGHNNSHDGPRKVFNSARHALRWLDKGIYPVPLERGTKRPKGEMNGSAKGANGWTKLRVTPASIPRYFKEGDNIGGLWGEPSAWAIDVDLDTPEAQVAATHFLPKTLTYGRDQAPGSHYIYRCKYAETKKFHTKDTGMIVEIRSTGSQSVLPGSTHPSGDRYRIDRDIAIAEIGWSRLQRLVNKIAAVSIAAYYYPDEGSRHDYVHALTGALLHAKWADWDVRAFMDAVRDAASEDDEEIKDRDGTIENTIKKYREGNSHIQGLPTLRNFMPELSIQNLKRYLGIGDFIPDNDETPPDSIAAQPVGQIDPRHFEVPGLVGTIMNWASRRSYLKQKLFDLAIGLMGTALATRNKYKVAGLDTPLQPYMMCVAGTAGGKNHIRDCLRELARKLGLNKQCFTGSQSYHAMLDLLSQSPHIALWVWDECARYLKASARNISSQENAILSHIISLYGTSIVGAFGMPARKNPIPDLDRPFLLVMGTTQPEQLLEAVTTTDFQTGFVNRFLLFDAGENMTRVNEQRYTGFPSAIEDAFKEFDKVKVPEGEFLEIEYVDSEAYATLDDFRTYQIEMAAKIEHGSDLWGRAHQNALIIAGLVAVGVDPAKPVITRQIALWAVEFVRWSVERWFVRIEQSSARSYTEAQSKDVERLIFQVRRYKDQAKDDKEFDLMDKGLCPVSWLARRCRYIKHREFKEILTALIQIGLIGSSISDERDVLWPKQTQPRRPTVH